MALRSLKIEHEIWPIAGSFTISRGAKTEAHVLVATIEQDGHIGRGECVPYLRNGETIESVLRVIGSTRPKIEAGISSHELQSLLPKGAARNALDCALVGLEAKLRGIPARELFALPEPKPVTTAYTISLGTPEEMAGAAKRAAGYSLLKVKLGGYGDEVRIAAVRSAAPKARLIVDANEAWSDSLLAALTAACLRANVELIEQPLPANDDEALLGFMSPVPFCADESCHDVSSLKNLAGKYQFVNVKLDKSGGITEAVALAREARKRELGVMLGCMVGTSLAMAPIAMLAPLAEFVDLDGPLLLARDRPDGIWYEGDLMHSPRSTLWG